MLKQFSVYRCLFKKWLNREKNCPLNLRNVLFIYTCRTATKNISTGNTVAKIVQNWEKSRQAKHVQK